MNYKKIYTDQQYNEYCEIHENLMCEDEEINRDQIELLEILIDEYESRTLEEITEENPVEILKYLLRENQLTNTQIAKELGVSKQLISEILKYKRNISKSMVIKLAERFNVSTDLFAKEYKLKSDGRVNQPA